MKRVLFTSLGLLAILIFSSFSTVSAATIEGTVTDSTNQQPLIGANVILQGTNMGAATNQDGAFTIRNVPEGTYTVVVSYIGYNTKRLSNLQVQANSEITMDIKMTPSAIQGETVVVEEEASQSSETHLLLDRKESTNMTDGISAEQMSQTGVSDAEDALTRVTGVSVMGDNNVYIRGLGDRYNQTQMNGVPVPSPDPEKKTVPLDMFSTSLLESVTALKTFTPDLPGVFAGGGVNIQTKAYPDNRILNIDIGGTQNFYVSPNVNYVNVDEGNYDFWGFDDGRRDLPESLPSEFTLSEFNTRFGGTLQERYATLGKIGKDFKTDFQPKSESIGTPLSFGLNFGNKFNPNDNIEYGFFTNVKFSNGFDYREVDDKEYSISNGNLSAYKDMYSNRSEYSTNIGASGSAGITLFNDHKIKLHHVYTHGSEERTIITEGFADNIDDGLFFKQFYREREINNTTLSGNHEFIALWQHNIDWSATVGSSTLEEPDVNTLNYRKRVDNEENVFYQMDVFSWSAATREYTSGSDDNQNFDFNYQATFYDADNAEYKLKFGGRLREKTRDFGKRIFYHKHSSNFPPSISQIDGQDQIGNGLVDNNYYSATNGAGQEDGLYIVENTTGSDGYDATENLNAQYAMIDIPLGLSLVPALNRVRFVGGVRREDYNLDLNPYHPVTGTPFKSALLKGDTVQSKIDEIKYLPSYNLIIGTTPNTNIRLSHSRTIARPQFREIAPFEFQLFYGDAVQVGFPFLKTTSIQNYDLRFEWFPQANELIALTGFYKTFDDPIETSMVQTSERTYRTPQNAISATNRGIEFELRKRLDFIPREIGQINVQMNTTYIQSEVETDSLLTLFNGVVTPNTATTKDRPLEGQSDVLFNASITYNNLSGFISTLSFNTFSKRINSLGTKGLPNIYEYPFDNMNLTATQRIGKFRISLKAKNLLGSVYSFGQIEPSTEEVKYTEKYNPGRSISLGVKYSL